MTIDATLEQIAAAGVSIQHMPGSSLGGVAPRLRRRVYNRATQLFMHWMVWRGRRLIARGDPEQIGRFVSGLRDLRDRMDHTSPRLEAMIDAEAVRGPGPRLGLPSPPMPAEWFAPRKGEPHGYVFYVHGGSFIGERSPRVTGVVARFAAAANARVFAPNYRLAPEHPCPAAVDDIVAAYRWFKSVYPDEPVVALAESAGVAILLAALQALRDDPDAPPPEGVVLLSPWVDLSLQSWSVVAASLAGTTPSTMQALALMAHFYLNGRSSTDPVASPLFGDFSDFPPTLIHASAADLLYDDAVRLAERIRADNGELMLRLWTDEDHVWERLEGEEGRRSITMAAEFIRRRLD